MNSDFGAFLPKHGDYSLKALTDIDYESKEKADPFRPNFKKRSKKSKWYIKVGSVKNDKVCIKNLLHKQSLKPNSNV